MSNTPPIPAPPISSPTDRRIALSAAKVMFEEGERQAESGNFDGVLAALVLVTGASRKLIEVVESLTWQRWRKGLLDHGTP